MRTERGKMLAGELYDALDPALVAERNRVRELCQKLNASRDAEEDLRRDLCKQIFGKAVIPCGCSRRSIVTMGPISN